MAAIFAHTPQMNRRQILTALAVTPLIAGLPALAPASSVNAQGTETGAGTGTLPIVRRLAQGTDLMPQVSVCWRAIQMDAKLPAKAPMLPRTLAFIMAWAGPMTVTNPDAGRTDHLNQWQATFGAQDQRQKRASATNHPVTYLGWELVVASDAKDPGTIGDSQVIALSDPFTAPQGTVHMGLYRGTVSADTVVEIEQGDFPAAIFALNDQAVVAGEDGRTTTLNRGDAMIIEGNVTIMAGQGAQNNTMVAAALFDRNGQAMTKPTSPPDNGEEKVVVFNLDDFKGAYTRIDRDVYQRPSVALYGSRTDYSTATLSFFLNQPGSGNASLTLVGLDDENPGPNPIRITLNNTTIYEGDSGFADWPEGGHVPWRPLEITFDGGIVVGGFNTLAISNRSDSDNIGTPPYILLAGGSLDVVIKSPF
jgi:hypothetical protein